MARKTRQNDITSLELMKMELKKLNKEVHMTLNRKNIWCKIN